MLKKSSGAGGETEADLPCPCRQLSLNCNVSRNHFLDPTCQVVVCICLYLILVCVFVQFLWFFLFRKSGKDDDEGVVEDEATWDWQSVVVPASPNRVCYACYIGPLSDLINQSWQKSTIWRHFPKGHCLLIFSQCSQVLPSAFNRTSLANVLVYNRVPK